MTCIRPEMILIFLSSLWIGNLFIKKSVNYKTIDRNLIGIHIEMGCDVSTYVTVNVQILQNMLSDGPTHRPGTTFLTTVVYCDKWEMHSEM